MPTFLVTFQYRDRLFVVAEFMVSAQTQSEAIARATVMCAEKYPKFNMAELEARCTQTNRSKEGH